MIKRLLTGVVAIMVATGAMAQANASDITKIKKSKEYIYAEATEATEEEAIMAAKAELDVQVEEYVVSSGIAKDAVAVVVKDIRQMTSKIAVMRGDMHRVFLYVKKKDITTSRSDVTVMNVENETPVTESKVEEIPVTESKVEEINETSQTELPVATIEVIDQTGSVENASDGFFSQIKGVRAATLAKIANAKSIAQAEDILSEEKKHQNVKGFGTIGNCRNITQSYWVVDTLDGVTILSPERAGTRWNYKTGKTDSLKNYVGKLWFRL